MKHGLKNNNRIHVVPLAVYKIIPHADDIAESKLTPIIADELKKLSKKSFNFYALYGIICTNEEVVETLRELKELPFYIKCNCKLSIKEISDIAEYLADECVSRLAEEKIEIADTDELNGYFLSAILALNSGQYSDALRDLCIYDSYSKELFKLYPHLEFYKGIALYGLRKLQLAATAFRNYLASSADDEIAHFYLGNVLFGLEKYNEAIAEYYQAIQLRGDFREALINTAVSVLRMGDEDTAHVLVGNDKIAYQSVFIDGQIKEDPFGDALAISSNLDIYDIPIFINSFNRLHTLKELVAWLTKAGYRRIFILDNASTYPPLLEYYSLLDKVNESVQVLRLGKNLGHKALWQSKILEILKVESPYVYTDSDVIPSRKCPKNVLQLLLNILKKYPLLKKVGLGLVTDDITFYDAEAVRKYEKRFYLHEMDTDVYFGAVDTTFALYRNYRHYNVYVSARTTGMLMARHMPWYYDYSNLPEDEQYYVAHANKSATLVHRFKECEGGGQNEKDERKRLVLWCDSEFTDLVVNECPSCWEIVCIINDLEQVDQGLTVNNIPMVNFRCFVRKFLRDVNGAFILMKSGMERMRAFNMLRYYGVSRIGFPRVHRAFDFTDGNIVWNDGRPYLSQLEIHIMDSCNLNCRGCTHFSNLFDKNTVYDIDKFAADLRQISSKVFVSTLYLLGGEPLLNPDISDYLYVARECFPYSEIVLITNGLLIPRQPSKVIEAFKNTNIDIEISLYHPTSKILDKIESHLKGRGVYYKIRAERPAFMSFIGLSGNSDPMVSSQKCCNAFCRYVRDGFLYKCPVDALSYKYNEKFNVKLPKSEGIDIYADDFERKLSLLNHPIQLCRYCSEEPRVFPWSSTVHPVKEDWFGNKL